MKTSKKEMPSVHFFSNWLLLLLVVVVSIGAAPLTEFSGPCSDVSDGDTITVLNDRTPVKVRLWGIDCPEGGQAHGDEAKKYTTDRALNKIVRIVGVEKDKYGRLVADVYLPDGTLLSAEIVREGHGWWFRKYAPDDDVLPKLESEARAAKRGLWADPNPMAPWDWRLKTGITSSPTPASAPQSLMTLPAKKSAAKPAASSDPTVYTTKTGTKYHRAGCEYLKESSIPISLSTAKARGLSPCSKCNPPR